MKILHIACIGHHAEGIGTVLQKLVPEQLKLGQDVRIISMYKNKTYSDLPIETITNKHVFIDFILSWPPDIVIFHSVYAMNYIHYYKILLKQHIPYLIQMHGALSESNYKNNHLKKLVANYLFFNHFIKNAQSIIYLNQNEYNNCIVKKINPSYLIIPNGCDFKDFPSLQVNKGQTIEIVFIGRIDFLHKGLDVLIQAIRIIQKAKITNIHFSFYGNPDDKDITKLILSLKGLENYAEYKGGIYGEEKDICLKNSNIFILTSRYEGMPMGVLEALSHGVPCILTRGTNLADDVAINNAGWGVDCTAEAISEIIIKAVNEYCINPDKFRKSAHELSKHYNWNAIAKSSLNYYTEFVKNQVNVPIKNLQ